MKKHKLVSLLISSFLLAPLSLGQFVESYKIFAKSSDKISLSENY